MSDVQTIKVTDGEDEFAVLPMSEYRRLVSDAEMLEDIAAAVSIEEKRRSGEEELIPADVVDRLLDGANPIRVWREFRGLTQDAVARAAGISRPHLVQLEKGMTDPTVSALGKIAGVLGIEITDLAPATNRVTYTEGIPDRCPQCGEDSIETVALASTAKATKRQRVHCASCGWNYIQKNLK